MTERPREFASHPAWYAPPQPGITERDMCEVIEYRNKPTINITIADQKFVINPAEAERLYFHLKTILGVED